MTNIASVDFSQDLQPAYKYVSEATPYVNFLGRYLRSNSDIISLKKFTRKLNQVALEKFKSHNLTLEDRVKGLNTLRCIWKHYRTTDGQITSSSFIFKLLLVIQGILKKIFCFNTRTERDKANNSYNIFLSFTPEEFQKVFGKDTQADRSNRHASRLENGCIIVERESLQEKTPHLFWAD